MKILRDEKTMLLGDVIAACHRVAEVCRTAAGAAQNPAVAVALAGLAEDRERLAGELRAEAARRLGETPSERVPEEITLIDKAAIRLGALIADDADPGLLTRCRDLERAVVEAAQAALPHFPDGVLHERLTSLGTDAARRIGRIEELAGGDTSS